MPTGVNYYNSGNVWVISSTAGPVSIPVLKRITAIKYFAGVNSSAALLAGSGSSTGAQLWFENSTGTGGTHVTDLLSIYDSDGFTVSLGGGAFIFIYATISRGV